MPAEIIKNFLNHLPETPGVYRMLGEQGEALYIGKAKNLKKRVTAYTTPEKHPYRLMRMIFLTAKMEFITTRTEAEALLLEAQLVRKLKPRYNVLLKDDKSFPFITISMNHEYPRIAKHRGAKTAGDLYFGPFASGKDVNENIRFLQRTFLVRPCKDSFFAKRTRPCLEYQIRRCSAPCVGKIGVEEYGKQVQEVAAFLKGQQHAVKERLAAQMEAASNNMQYELAAQLRDRLKSLSSLQSKQSFRVEDLGDTDVIALHHSEQGCVIDLFSIRGGQACGNRAIFPKHTEDATSAEIMEDFLAQHYQLTPPPALLLLNTAPENVELMEEALSTLSERSVKIEMPQRGTKAELVTQIYANATAALEHKHQVEAKNRVMLKEVANIFGLKDIPQRIEVYDNSHISGQLPVGAMIVSGPEGFLKNEYRHYWLEDQLGGGDDFAMMRFVFTKRLKKILKEKDDEKIPDLILIDGGSAHLAVVSKIFEELGVTNIPYACISKGPDRNAGNEEFHLPGKPSFRLTHGTPVLHFLQRLRDEAHRFAISTHRNRRSKALTTSVLDSIPGIGAKRKKALLQHFGGVEGIKEATLAEIAQVPGINRKTAEEVQSALKA
jgi:excinuclease ABC subunit C